ncbi:MAG: hypothetical protein H6719_14910 [Sandaracinaceae bacterium]|nr:hypothetical protein [Sandaracinaceae bacterium]
MLRLALALSVVGVVSACDGGPAPVDAGADDAGFDAGTIDAGPPTLAIPAPGEPMPAQLSALGLTPDGAWHPDLIAYAPAYPLWTNGSDKVRHLYLPPGAQVTGSVPFDFPVGATLFKQFAYGEQRVETRVMRLTADGWEFFVYQWEGDDATLLDGAIPVDLEVATADGPVPHRIPSQRNCRTCHESNADREVIGFRVAQLADQLDALTARGVFETRPADPPPIEGRDALETRVLQYAYGNCVHCHNGLSGPNRSFDLRPDAFVANVVGVPTMSSASPSGVRVVAGDPEASVLYVAMTRDDDFLMPPIGVQRVDGTALEMFHEWIASLP